MERDMNKAVDAAVTLTFFVGLCQVRDPLRVTRVPHEHLSYLSVRTRLAPHGFYFGVSIGSASGRPDHWSGDLGVHQPNLAGVWDPRSAAG